MVQEAEAAGEDYERQKMLQTSASELERLERKRKKTNPDPGFSGEPPLCRPPSLFFSLPSSILPSFLLPSLTYSHFSSHTTHTLRLCPGPVQAV